MQINMSFPPPRFCRRVRRERFTTTLLWLPVPEIERAKKAPGFLSSGRSDADTTLPQV